MRKRKSKNQPEKKKKDLLYREEDKEWGQVSYQTQYKQDYICKLQEAATSVSTREKAH